MPKVKKSIMVDAPVAIVYRAWHNFESFPRFMDNIEDVRVVGARRSHWKAKGPLGTAPEWDAEITLDEPDHTIGWRSVEGSTTKTAGRVDLDGRDGATKLEVMLEYEAPAGGVLGDAIARIFKDPVRQIDADLRRFKQIVEDSVRMSTLTTADADHEDALGASMGATTESGLDAISGTNSGIAPEGVDDPATRPD